MRLIDADALMQTLGITDMDCHKCAWGDKKWSRCERGGDFENACYAIENAPTIEERKTGEWIPFGVRHGWVCSNCKKEDVYAFSINETGDYEMQDFFCPNCGADMTRGEENG